MIGLPPLDIDSRWRLHGAMSGAGKTLVVSLHDAHPGSADAIQRQIDFLGAYGIKAASILVVPDFHHGAPVAKNAGFCEGVSRWQDSGHEIVLHGYYHDRRESPRETLATLFWTRLYTSREAEFLDLPHEEARIRLRRGRELFGDKGWTVRGFIAPAWLMAPHVPNLCGELGFTYTNTLRELIPLVRGGGRPAIASQSLCYSTRAGWRRLASAAWNRQLFGKLRGTNLIRLSLHPRDLEFALLRRQIDQIVRAALARGFEPTTYAEYIARPS
jgi:predicted deacetylase